MLEDMFPRHVLEFVMGPEALAGNMGRLASQHEDVRGAATATGSQGSGPQSSSGTCCLCLQLAKHHFVNSLVQPLLTHLAQAPGLYCIYLTYCPPCPPCR